MSAMSVWMEFQEEGINLGVSREFAKNAGKALSIPATNQPSACTRLIGRRNLRLATDHHARTGIEKPSSHRGTASKIKMAIAPSDIPDEAKYLRIRIQEIGPMGSMREGTPAEYRQVRGGVPSLWGSS